MSFKDATRASSRTILQPKPDQSLIRLFYAIDMDKPEGFPPLSYYFRNYGIDTEQLKSALADYLNDIDQMIRDEFNHYEQPFDWLQAKQYEAAVEAFTNLLNEETEVRSFPILINRLPQP